MSSLDFVGYLVSIDIGNNRRLVGRISSVDPGNQIISLLNPTMNNVTMGEDSITIRNDEIMNLQVLNKPTIDDVVTILNVDPATVEDEPVIDVTKITKKKPVNKETTKPTTPSKGIANDKKASDTVITDFVKNMINANIRVDEAVTSSTEVNKAEVWKKGENVEGKSENVSTNPKNVSVVKDSKENNKVAMPTKCLTEQDILKMYKKEKKNASKLQPQPPQIEASKKKGEGKPMTMCVYEDTSSAPFDYRIMKNPAKVESTVKVQTPDIIKILKNSAKLESAIKVQTPDVIKILKNPAKESKSPSKVAEFSPQGSSSFQSDLIKNQTDKPSLKSTPIKIGPNGSPTKSVQNSTPITSVQTTPIQTPSSVIASNAYRNLNMIPTSCIKSMNRKGTLTVTPSIIKDIVTKKSEKSTTDSASSSLEKPFTGELNKHTDYGQFKYFENPQIPDPEAIALLKEKQNGQDEGIVCPITKNNAKTRKLKKNVKDLDQPINYDEVELDFDFEANHSLFEKDMASVDVSNDVSFKNSKNFAHDENILDDPTRLTSWTNKNRVSQLALTALSHELVGADMTIPVFSVEDQQKFFDEGIKIMGKDMIYSTVGDRLFSFIIDSTLRCDFNLQNTVVIGNKKVDKTLIKKIGISIQNRNCEFDEKESSVTFYNIEESQEFSNGIKYVTSSRQLTLQPSCVIILTETFEELPRETQMWLIRVGNGPRAVHAFSIDYLIKDITYPHTLFKCFGTKTSHLQSFLSNGAFSLPREDNNTSFGPLSSSNISQCNSQSTRSNNNPCTSSPDLFKDGAVADLGIPYKFLDSESKQVLAQLFSSSSVTRF
uniref:LSM14 domain-containing protein n=1 Tax=Rhabditophanes sp. KR3021 TaxID=114890 RepID=A0AC35UDK1_9BILA